MWTWIDGMRQMAASGGLMMRLLARDTEASFEVNGSLHRCETDLHRYIRDISDTSPEPNVALWCLVVFDEQCGGC
jgi:hypothetical protein